METESLSTVEYSDPLSKAMNEISRTGLPVIVLRGGKYAGMIDERAIRAHHTIPSKEKCGTLAQKTPTLSPESTVMDACNAFFTGRYKAVPVFKGNSFLGAITRHTLLNELLTEKMLSRKRVFEVMTSPVASIEESSTVGYARSELRRHNIRRVVVTSKGKITGLLSVFDLAKLASKPNESSSFYRGGEKTSMDAQPISSYIKREVETIGESESLSSAVKKMLDRRVAALVVSDSGYPRGIVTAKDILQTALSHDKPAAVFVSGLPYELHEFGAEISREGEKLIARLGKSIQVRSLAFHIKSEGSGFSVRAQLTGSKPYNASASDFRLEVAVGRVLDEIRKMAAKDKPQKISRRKNRKDEA